MPDPTPAEIEAGALALSRYDWDHNLTANGEIGPHHRAESAAVLRAVLPDHDAAVRSEADAYRQRVDALEALLVCYRTGRQPSEALHQRLSTTRQALERIHTSERTNDDA